MRIRANNPILTNKREHTSHIRSTEYVPRYVIPEPFTEEWYRRIGEALQRENEKAIAYLKTLSRSVGERGL